MKTPAPPRQIVQADALADMIAQALPPDLRHVVTSRVGRDVLGQLEQRGWRLQSAAVTTVDTDRLATLLDTLEQQRGIHPASNPDILGRAYAKLKAAAFMFGTVTK